MAIDFTNDVQDVSYEEIKKAAKWCLATGAFGVSKTISGRSISFNSPEQCITTIRFCDEQIAAESDSNDGIALLRFNENS